MFIYTFQIVAQRYNKYRKKNRLSEIFLIISLKRLRWLYYIQVSQVRELIQVKEVITPYGRSGS